MPLDDSDVSISGSGLWSLAGEEEQLRRMNAPGAAVKSECLKLCVI